MAETPQEITARKFLSKGIIDNISENDLASILEHLIQTEARKSLKSALIMARNFDKRAAGHSAELRLTASRTLARITHMSGQHAEALKAYLRARDLLRKKPVMRARLDRALIDVYMYLGDFEKSKRAAGRAINVFMKEGLESDLAQTRVNYANLLHRQDRHREAEKLYYEASQFFKRAGNMLAVARCDYNRANTLVQLFDFETAEQLYQKAQEIYDKEGFDLDANDARYGLAWLRLLSGKFHIALLELEECQKTYHDGGDPRGEALCTLDRAEVFLGLGLYKDALENGRRSEQLFSKLKMRYEKSKSSLFRAHAAHALKRRAEARKALEHAKYGFIKEKNHGFIGASLMLEADLERKDSRQKIQLLKKAHSYFAKAQLPYWEAICDLQQAANSQRPDNIIRQTAKNKAVHVVPHLYALWQTISGDSYFDAGNLPAARRHWQSAADRIDLVRAQLPPMELRSAFGRKHNSPHQRLIESEAEHEPSLAAAWSERYKTAGIWARLASKGEFEADRKRIQGSLEQLALQVSSLAHQIEGKSGERGMGSLSGSHNLALLQKKIRDELLAIEKDGEGFVDDPKSIINSIKSSSKQLPIIQFHMSEKDIYAFVHHHGKTDLHIFDNGRFRLSEIMARWRFIMEGELLGSSSKKQSGSQVERMLWQEFGKWLWEPLKLSGDAKKVLIIPEGELANIPWQALIVDNQYLAERLHFILSPSLRHYLAAKKNLTKSRKVRIFRGKAGDLPQADRELSILSKRAEKYAITHNPCRRADWPDSGEANLWHFAGHAVLKRDNPFYSYLRLEDGPLFAADFRLKKCTVNLVTLAACRSGEQVALPGEEATGLVRSLLEMGARNVIAGHWPVSDETTALWMSAFYDKYFDDYDLLDAAGYAAGTVRKKFPSAYHWAAFSISGAGDIGGDHA